MTILRKNLKICKIRPDESILFKMVKSESMLDFACESVENTNNVYLDYKNLPKSFTCGVVQDQLHIHVNGPSLGDSKPFILSAVDETGKQLMVKLLRIDADSTASVLARQEELSMEIRACNMLNLERDNAGFIKAELMEVNIPTIHAAHAGVAPGRIQAIIMPKYSGTVATSAALYLETLAVEGRRIFNSLKAMHEIGLVHMDVKGTSVHVCRIV